MMKENNKIITIKMIKEKDNRNRTIKVDNKIKNNRTSTKKIRISNNPISNKLLINTKEIIFKKIRTQRQQIKRIMPQSIHFSF